MITIALDEGGHFENLRPSENCMYIGGVVFQCKDENTRKRELERLQNYFKEICNNEGCRYPHREKRELPWIFLPYWEYRGVSDPGRSYVRVPLFCG